MVIRNHSEAFHIKILYPKKDKMAAIIYLDIWNFQKRSIFRTGNEYIIILEGWVIIKFLQRIFYKFCYSVLFKMTETQYCR